ncbi:hypothetical protein D3C87_1974940 [compost metagenome]
MPDWARCWLLAVVGTGIDADRRGKAQDQPDADVGLGGFLLRLDLIGVVKRNPVGVTCAWGSTTQFAATGNGIGQRPV